MNTLFLFGTSTCQYQYLKLFLYVSSIYTVVNSFFFLSGLCLFAQISACINADTVCGVLWRMVIQGHVWMFRHRGIVQGQVLMFWNVGM